MNVPWKVRGALLSLLTEDFLVQECRRLPSRRNVVLHITGTHQSTRSTLDIVAKWFKQLGIAVEAQVLRDAYSSGVPVPKIIGTTAHVILMQYVSGQNLCDLINSDQDPLYGMMLGQWLATYHQRFQREDNPDIVLLKGDARIRNFIHDGSRIIGVDFEECTSGYYLKDLASTCASILDTDPLFTPEKRLICRMLLTNYSRIRGTSDQQRILEDIIPYLLDALRETATRRRKPSELLSWIDRYEAGTIQI